MATDWTGRGNWQANVLDEISGIRESTGGRGANVGKKGSLGKGSEDGGRENMGKGRSG